MSEEIDRLATERNTALGTARLWERRMFVMQHQRDRAVFRANSLGFNAVEWQVAYDELLRAHRRLEVRYSNALDGIETLNFLIEHYEPLAMAQLEALIKAG